MTEPKSSYREIVRPTDAASYSQREIAAAVGCPNGAVAYVQKRAKASGLGNDELLKLGEAELRQALVKPKGPKIDADYAQPDRHRRRLPSSPRCSKLGSRRLIWA